MPELREDAFVGGSPTHESRAPDAGSAAMSAPHETSLGAGPERTRVRAMMARAQLALVLVVAVGCSSGGRARDVAGDRSPRGTPSHDAGTASTASVPEAPQGTAQPPRAGTTARLFARASARGLAIDATTVYYGDTADDAIYAAPKAGGGPVRLARHAPVAGAIALDAESVVWIASPGDAVLKLPLKAPPDTEPKTLRDRGIFSDVAVATGEVFITEALGAGGALIRVTGATASRIASFDGAPRAVAADGTHAYVITPTKIFRAPHAKGELETIATGVAFANPQMDDAFLYVLTEVAKVRVVARLPKAGGPLVAVARDVRDAPFELEGGEVLFFDAVRPQLRAVPAAGGDVRIVIEDEALATASSIVADATTAYVATGSRESGSILAVDRR